MSDTGQEQAGVSNGSTAGQGAAGQERPGDAWASEGVTVEEAAALLGVSTKTIRRAVQAAAKPGGDEGDLSPAPSRLIVSRVTVGGRVRTMISRASLDKWGQERKQQHTPPAQALLMELVAGQEALRADVGSLRAQIARLEEELQQQRALPPPKRRRWWQWGG